jgi:predicted exporter
VKRSEAFWLGLTLLLLAPLAVFVWLRFAVTTDVSVLLPPDGDQELSTITRRVAESELGRSMVLTIGARDPERVVAASRSFEAALRAEPRVQVQLAALEAGASEGTEQALYQLYQPRRLGFFAASPAAAREQLRPEALRAAARTLKERLSQPMSMLIARLAPSDPLLILTHLFEQLQRVQAHTLRLQDGRFVTADGRYAVLFLRTKARGFDSEAQTPLLAGVNEAFRTVNRQFGGKLVLDQSGVNRFAVQAQAAISGDIERISLLSSLGLGVLLFAVFRSFRLIAVASLPLGAGFLVGLSACLAVYGRVHGITLAFGSSLLGVALDYVEHVYCHQAVMPHPDGPRGTLRAIAPALITGAATTLIGFLALGGSGFRGLEEVALFSSTGLIASLLTTFSMLPALLPATTPRVIFRERIVAWLGRVFVGLRARRRALWILPAAAIGVTAIGLPKLRMSEDFTLGQLDPRLLAEDQRVRARVTRFDQNRFVIAIGHDDDAALRVNDQVARLLDGAVTNAELGGYRGVSDFLPSPSQQRAVDQAVRDTLGSGAGLVAAFEAEGFRAEAFAAFLKTLAVPAAKPLEFADLARSPLASLVAPFRVPLRDGVGFVTFLNDVKSAERLSRQLSALHGAHFIDQQAQFKRAHHAYQTRTLQLVLLGTLGVFVLLALRYRNVRKTLAAFLPSLLATFVTLACLALSGYQLNILALAALLMVISMGVDYGVFLVDESETESEPTTALLSVFFAATTSVLGFGLLALSKHPMLAMIGLTAFVGMTVCAVLSPTTLVLLGEQRAHDPARKQHP